MNEVSEFLETVRKEAPLVKLKRELESLPLINIGIIDMGYATYDDCHHLRVSPNSKPAMELYFQTSCARFEGFIHFWCKSGVVQPYLEDRFKDILRPTKEEIELYQMETGDKMLIKFFETIGIINENKEPLL